MIIIDALKLAKTEHVVYFLLNAYIEAVDYMDATRGLPEQAKRLPVRGIEDVARRVRVLRAMRKRSGPHRAAEAGMIDEALTAFGAAAERLRMFQPARVPCRRRSERIRYSCVRPVRALVQGLRLLARRPHRGALAA